LETGGSGENTGGTVVIVGNLVDGRRGFAAGSGESARGRGGRLADRTMFIAVNATRVARQVHLSSCFFADVARPSDVMGLNA